MATFEETGGVPNWREYDAECDYCLRFDDVNPSKCATYVFRGFGDLVIDIKDCNRLWLDRPLAAKLAGLLAFYAANGTIEGFREDEPAEATTERGDDALPPGWTYDAGDDGYDGPDGFCVWKSRCYPEENTWVRYNPEAGVRYFPDRAAAMRGTTELPAATEPAGAAAEPASDALPPGWRYDEDVEEYRGPGGVLVYEANADLGKWYRGNRYYPTRLDAMYQTNEIPDDAEPDLEGRVDALADHYDALQAEFADLKAKQALAGHETKAEFGAMARRVGRDEVQHNSLALDIESLERRIAALEGRRKPVSGPSLNFGQLRADAIVAAGGKPNRRRDVS